MQVIGQPGAKMRYTGRMKKLRKGISKKGAPTKRKVAVLIDLVGVAGRSMLSGISRFP